MGQIKFAISWWCDILWTCGTYNPIQFCIPQKELTMILHSQHIVEMWTIHISWKKICHHPSKGEIPTFLDVSTRHGKLSVYYKTSWVFLTFVKWPFLFFKNFGICALIVIWQFPFSDQNYYIISNEIIRNSNEIFWWEYRKSIWYAMLNKKLITPGRYLVLYYKFEFQNFFLEVF